MSRISTSRQHGMASFAASLAAGRPASASATLASASVSVGGAAANGVVSPGSARRTWTARTGADAFEPADVRDHPQPAGADRKVGQFPLIAGVNPGRAPAAPRARRVARTSPDPERHQVSAQLDAVHRGSSELRQKRINGL
jgi:hypothetical protein